MNYQRKRILVCGSRGFDDANLFNEVINDETDPFRGDGELTLVHGAARGADSLAARWCRESTNDGGSRDLEEVHPADWNTHGKRAGILRNIEMAKLGADLCIAFWDGESPGTQHMIATATRHGIPVRIVPFRKS